MHDMLNIKIVVVGKFKESYWKDAEAEYLKRLKPYAKIEIVELKEEAFRDNDDRNKVKATEADKIKKHLDTDAFVIAMHEAGKKYDSVSFSKFLSENSTRGEKLTFVFGGPLGLDQSIHNLAQTQLSLSQLTFPHQMVRVILLEQIYRAITIQKEKTYHY